MSLAIFIGVDGNRAAFGVGDSGACTIFDINTIGVLALNRDIAAVGDGVLAFAINTVSVVGIAGYIDRAGVGDGASGVCIHTNRIATVIAMDFNCCAFHIQDRAVGCAVHTVSRAGAIVL